MLTRKLFLSALGVVVSGGLGICAQLVGVTLLVAVPTLLVLAAGCIAAAAVLIRGTRKWAPHPVFQGNGYDRHELKGVFWAVASAIAANALFVGFWVAQPTLWPLWLSLIAVMAAATYFGARSHAYARENMRRNPAEIVPKAAATPAASTAQAQPGAAPGQTASAPHPRPGIRPAQLQGGAAAREPRADPRGFQRVRTRP